MNMVNKCQDKVSDIISNAKKYHSEFYPSEPATLKFNGPSLYFHMKSLQSRDADNFECHLEYIYATLVSWGMHRMGPRGSKMLSFQDFKKSIEKIKPTIEKAKNIDYQNINDSGWKLLEDIFNNIKIMHSKPRLVDNSKVMAHMFPNIIPPIDGEYTLMYLKENKYINIANGWEWNLMKEIISVFFIPVAKDENFLKQANEWGSKQEIYPWDTSVFKIIDNLIIGVRKLQKKST